MSCGWDILIVFYSAKQGVSHSFMPTEWWKRNHTRLSTVFCVVEYNVSFEQYPTITSTMLSTRHTHTHTHTFADNTTPQCDVDVDLHHSTTMTSTMLLSTSHTPPRQHRGGLLPSFVTPYYSVERSMRSRRYQPAQQTNAEAHHGFTARDQYGTATRKVLGRLTDVVAGFITEMLIIIALMEDVLFVTCVITYLSSLSQEQIIISNVFHCSSDHVTLLHCHWTGDTTIVTANAGLSLLMQGKKLTAKNDTFETPNSTRHIGQHRPRTANRTVTPQISLNCEWHTQARVPSGDPVSEPWGRGSVTSVLRSASTVFANRSFL